jgi:hypothetical protein
MTTATDSRIVDQFFKLNTTLAEILDQLQDMNVHLENISDGIDSLQKEEESG